MKPNLFIVGAPKCGTTAWAQYLASHPAIHISTPKEPHFFCTDFPALRKPGSLAEYLALFDQAGDASVVGEASASYLYSREAAANLHRFDPAAKIIIFVRDRPELLRSWHNQLLYNRVENHRVFEDAWALSGQRGKDDHGPACEEKSFLDYRAFGQLGEQVERFTSLFDAGQMRIFELSEWASDPRPTYLSILRFLGVSDDGRDHFARVNEALQSRLGFIRLFLRKPPKSLARLYHFVRRTTGWNATALTQAISDLNAKKGYVEPLSWEMREQIDKYYRPDVRKLARLREALNVAAVDYAPAASTHPRVQDAY